MRPVSSLMSPAKPFPTPTSPPTRHPIFPAPPPHFRTSFPHDFVTSLPHSSAPPQNSAPLFSIPYTLHIFGLSEDHLATPLESALPRNPKSPPANPIESTRFFTVVHIFAKSVSVTLASTTLTKHTPRNPIRMNTSTKHVVPRLHQCTGQLHLNRLLSVISAEEPVELEDIYSYSRRLNASGRRGNFGRGVSPHQNSPPQFDPGRQACHEHRDRRYRGHPCRAANRPARERIRGSDPWSASADRGRTHGQP